MSFWTCTVAVANLGVAKLGRFVPFTGAGLFFFYAACCLVAAFALALIARRYRMVDYYRRA
jgi:proton-dependent oligopeptide transporter, POT family